MGEDELRDTMYMQLMVWTHRRCTIRKPCEMDLLTSFVLSIRREGHEPRPRIGAFGADDEDRDT